MTFEEILETADDGQSVSVKLADLVKLKRRAEDAEDDVQRHLDGSAESARRIVELHGSLLAAEAKSARLVEALYVANASIKDCDDAIATIRTLSARAEAAERELTNVREGYQRELLEMTYAKQAAEARAEGARAEALEEAAKMFDAEAETMRARPPGEMTGTVFRDLGALRAEQSAKAIRALRTAPSPTAKESET